MTVHTVDITPNFPALSRMYRNAVESNGADIVRMIDQKERSPRKFEKVFHDFIYSVTMAIHTSTDAENVQALRTVLSDVLDKTAKARRGF